jgi:hypothetical protein
MGGDGEDGVWFLGMFGMVGMEARALPRFWRFEDDLFCFYSNAHRHIHPTLGTGQKEKLWPDDKEQEDIDGAL